MTAAELVVTLNGKDVGLKSLLMALERDLKKADAAAEKTAAALASKLASGSERAGASALRLAQAQARGAVAAGDLARAEQILQTALVGVDRGTIGAINAQTQLTRVQNQLTKSTQESHSAFSQLTQAAGTLGVAFGVQQIISSGVELAKTGAKAELVTTRFNALATAAGTTGDALLTALRKASGGEISDLNLQLAANRANLLGVATSAEELGVLMEIARDRAQTLGTTATEAFNDLVTGLGRGSPLILDNLGIIVDITAANEVYAASVGKTVSQLTEAEKKQALINQVVADGKASLDATGGAAETTASKFDRLGTAAENAGNKLGVALANRFAPGADEATKFLDAIARLIDGTATLKTNMDALVGSQQVLGTLGDATFNPIVGAIAGYNEAVLSAGAGTLTWLGLMNESTAATTAAAAGYNGAAEAAALQEVATRAASDASITNTGVLDQEAAKALVAAANNKVLEQAKLDLEAAARAAADGIIASGGNIEAEAVRLANSSSLIDQLTAAYLRLADATGAADKAQRQKAGRIRLAQQESRTDDLTDGSGVGFDAPGRRGGGDVLATIKQSQADIAQAEKEAEAKRLKDEKKAESDRLKLAKGGGAARVSEAQKTNDQLLDAARDYQDEIAQIEADGLKTRAAAERSLKSAQLSSRASFYGSLASIDDNALRADLSARYEQAATEAGKIAQTQGADAAQKYLEASRQQIEGESAIQQQIQEARDSGDAGQAEYLEGVLALQQAANADELALISEQADAALAAEAARYTAAEAQYAEHLARMGGIAAAAGTTLGATLPNVPIPVGVRAPGAAAPAPGSGKPTPVIDLATPAAVDANGARTEGKLSDVIAELASIRGEIGALRGDVRGLKLSRATAGG